MKYSQTVLMKGHTMGPSVSRQYQYLLPILCAVNRETNKTEHLGAPGGSVSDLPTENSSISIDLTIKVFKDPDFTDELKTPVNVSVGVPIAVKLSVDSNKLYIAGPRTAKIIVDECFAIPCKGCNNNKHWVIKKSRAVDEGTQFIPSPFLYEARFTMAMFSLRGDKDDLYLSCKAYVCPIGDTSSQCKNPDADHQHEEGANRLEFPIFSSDVKPPSGSISVMTDEYGVVEPKLKRQPILYDDSLPGLDPDDEVRMGLVDDVCYRIRKTGISKYFAPKKPNRNKLYGTSAEIEKCLKQTLNKPKIMSV